MSARLWGSVAAAGLALLIAAAIGLAHQRSMPGQFGTTTASPRDRPTRSPTAVPGTPTAAVRAPVVVRTHPVARASVAPALPVRLAIPPLGVNAPVEPVGTTDGALDVPTDPARLGWWTGSALPGAPGGSIVIDGHVDSAATGPGALFRLTALRAGDPITVTTATGAGLRFSVTGRRVYSKTHGLPSDLFSATGAPRLVVITCGGPFDRTTGSYLDNVVVFAAPVRN